MSPTVPRHVEDCGCAAPGSRPAPARPRARVAAAFASVPTPLRPTPAGGAVLLRRRAVSAIAWRRDDPGWRRIPPLRPNRWKDVDGDENRLQKSHRFSELCSYRLLAGPHSERQAYRSLRCLSNFVENLSGSGPLGKNLSTVHGVCACNVFVFVVFLAALNNSVGSNVLDRLQEFRFRGWNAHAQPHAIAFSGLSARVKCAGCE